MNKRLAESAERILEGAYVAAGGVLTEDRKHCGCPLCGDTKGFSFYRNSAGEARWKCYAGCNGGKSGTAVDLVMNMERVTAKEAVEKILHRFGSEDALETAAEAAAKALETLAETTRAFVRVWLRSEAQRKAKAADSLRQAVDECRKIAAESRDFLEQQSTRGCFALAVEVAAVVSAPEIVAPLNREDKKQLEAQAFWEGLLPLIVELSQTNNAQGEKVLSIHNLTKFWVEIFEQEINPTLLGRKLTEHLKVERFPFYGNGRDRKPGMRKGRNGLGQMTYFISGRAIQAFLATRAAAKRQLIEGQLAAEAKVVAGDAHV